MNLNEDEWRVLNAEYHNAFRKTSGYQGFKSPDEISKGEGFEVLRKLRKVTGEFEMAAKAANDSVVRIIYDNKDPLPQTTSNVSEENHGRSISLHSSPLATRELHLLRPQIFGGKRLSG